MKIRCIIKKKSELYVAMSLEFGLATQADSLEEVRERLEAQIDDYIHQACGEDVAHKEQLLARKGPASWFVTYYIVQLLHHLHFLREGLIAFKEYKTVCTHSPRHV